MATINYWGLSSVKDSVTVALTITIDQLITAIAADEGLPTDYYKISLLNNPAINDVVYGDSSTTLTAMGMVDGDTVLCTPNQVGTKEDRQIQKLEIAKVNRARTSRRSVYDISELPTKYSGNTIVDNINSGGLVVGRPWGTSETPNLFSGLSIWYDTALASTINGGTFSDGTTVTTLTNRATSTNGTPPSTREPTVQNGVGDTLNGYPVVRFATTGSYDAIRFSTNAFDDATGWTVVMLAKTVSTVGFNPSLFMIIDNTLSTVSGVRYLSNNAFVFYCPVGTATVNTSIDPDGTWKIITMRYDSTAVAASRCTFRWAKVARTVTNGGTPPSGTIPAIATQVETMSAWDGDLAEQIAYNRALTDDEIIALEDYLSSKWGV